MRYILGDVLGENFKHVTLKDYKKTLKEIEDEEDYKTAKQALREDKDKEKIEKEEKEGLLNVEEELDIDALISAIPDVYAYSFEIIQFLYKKEHGKAEQIMEAKVEAATNVAEKGAIKERQSVGFLFNMPKALKREVAVRLIENERSKYVLES